MMKKLIWLLVVVSMLLSFTACGGGSKCTEHLDNTGDGKCDSCGADMPGSGGENNGSGENNGNNTGETGPVNGDKINIAHSDFVVLYNYDNKSEKVLAESFIESLKVATGVQLELKPNKDDSAVYKIQFGKLKANAIEFNEVYNGIKDYENDENGVFSITFKENVLVVTGTDDNALSAASSMLLSYISGQKLELQKGHSETYLLYSDNGVNTAVNLNDYGKTADITSIVVNGEKLLGYSNGVNDYTFYYNGSYPEKNQVVVNTLNPNAQGTVSYLKGGASGFKVSVTSTDGSVKKDVTIRFTKLDLTDFGMTIVNKNGAQGVVSFVFDDGNVETADILNTLLLPKYTGISITHGLITKNLYDGVGGNPTNKYTYASKIEGSKYTGGKYTYNYQFWQDILRTAEQELSGRVEFLSHSHTHALDGMLNDVELEVKGSKQILKDTFGIDATAFIRPGVRGFTYDLQGPYLELLEKSGTYIGARTNMTMLNGYQVNLHENFKNTNNRFYVASLTATYHSTQISDSTGLFTTGVTASKEECLAAGISHWTNYIDEAVKQGGWAPYCFHSIKDDATYTHPTEEGKTNDYMSYQSQVDALFAYTQALVDEGKVWCATYSDAQKYYNSWSTAKVSSSSTTDGRVVIKITDGEPDSIYDVALTVKVTIPDSWTTVNYSYAGENGTLEVKTDENGSKFVYVNTVPDSEGFIIWNS